jgi:hypothetical protein
MNWLYFILGFILGIYFGWRNYDFFDNYIQKKLKELDNNK